MEVSFKSDIEHLAAGDGEIVRGEAILAVTKALLQSGVSYVGGYQGAPVSHLLDIMVQARELLEDLGVHVEPATSEAAAAAMLGASIGYPLRGAVTWKSVVGTNVASDALSNLASAGVTGGALILVGEDYGEGASVIQERTQAFALKSSLCLLDPRPELTHLVDMVGRAFELSEASATPVMLQLRIRACHLFGEFVARDNVRPTVSQRDRLPAPAGFDYDRLSHPPATFAQERIKVEERLPAARRFIVEQGVNETFSGDIERIGIVLPGGLYNSVIQQLGALELAEIDGTTRVPLLVLNAIHPLVPEQLVGFARNRDAILVLEEGQPDYLQQAVEAELRRAGIGTAVHGKDLLPASGEYTPEVIGLGLTAFLTRTGTGFTAVTSADSVHSARTLAAELLAGLPARPPTFCTGCPERPVFTALKLLQREQGTHHVAADIGCHALATFPPFDSGHTILGYGMSLASTAAMAPTQVRTPISIMGDGGFWHNGLTSGVAGAVANGNDSVLIVLDNGYSAATGGQRLPSSLEPGSVRVAARIDRVLRALGVRWVRRIRSYDVRTLLRALRHATERRGDGPKVIVAEGECMLAVQRRRRHDDAQRRERRARTSQTRFGVDADLCSGDHSCIRLSGCPSLTLAPTPDPLRRDPVATVDTSCVGCGHCGEVVHAAQLCPSFHSVEVVRHPGLLERTLDRARRRIIDWLGGAQPHEA